MSGVTRIEPWEFGCLDLQLRPSFNDNFTNKIDSMMTPYEFGLAIVISQCASRLFQAVVHS